MHRKTINLAAICAVVILLVFVYTQKNKKLNTSEKANIAVDTQTLVQGKVEIDENNYQESIFKAIVQQQLLAFEKLTDSYKKKPGDTLTDQITKDIFGEYIQYNVSGELDSQTISKTTESAIKNQQLPRSNITLKQIRLAKATLANLKAYGNNMIIVQNSLGKAVASVSNKKDQEKYLPALYSKTAELLAKQPVPTVLAQYHLNLINAYRDFAYSFKIMELQSTDPARALLGVNNAKQASESIVKNFSEIQRIIKANKVEYSSKEPAYRWINEIENSIITTE